MIMKVCWNQRQKKTPEEWQKTKIYLLKHSLLNTPKLEGMINIQVTLPTLFFFDKQDH